MTRGPIDERSATRTRTRPVEAPLTVALVMGVRALLAEGVIVPVARCFPRDGRVSPAIGTTCERSGESVVVPLGVLSSRVCRAGSGERS